MGFDRLAVRDRSGNFATGSSAMLVVKPSWSAAGFGGGASLAATGGAARLAVALGGGASSVAVGEARMTAGGDASTSGDGIGRASERGGASEVWHLAPSSSQKLTDKNPMANSAAFFIRIPENRFDLNDGGHASRKLLILCMAVKVDGNRSREP
jgi:hypothetical protein